MKEAQLHIFTWENENKDQHQLLWHMKRFFMTFSIFWKSNPRTGVIFILNAWEMLHFLYSLILLTELDFHLPMMSQSAHNYKDVLPFFSWWWRNESLRMRGFGFWNASAKGLDLTQHYNSRCHIFRATMQDGTTEIICVYQKDGPERWMPQAADI